MPVESVDDIPYNLVATDRPPPPDRYLLCPKEDDKSLHKKERSSSYIGTKYGSIERAKERTRSLLSWVSSDVSYGIGDSLNIHLAGALMSHADIPSNDG